MNHTGTHTDERPIGELFKAFANDTSTLIRQELALARVELTAKAKTAGAGAGMFGASALLGLGAFAALTTCLIALIALKLALWASALIVAAVYGAGAAAVAKSGQKKLAEVGSPVPEQAMNSVRQDVAVAASRARHAG